MAKTPVAAGAREPAAEKPVEGSGATPNAPAEQPIETEKFTLPPALDPDTKGTVAPGTDGTDAKTIKVKTTGPFMLQDPYTLEVVEQDTKEPVTHTSFIDTALADGRLVKA